MTESDYSVAAIYDKFSAYYREYSQSRNKYLNSIEKIIVNKFKCKVSNLLDYGSGDGVRGVKIFESLKAKNLYQADISTEMLKKCFRHGKAKKIIDVREKNWEKQLSDIDLIICLWNVFGHLEDTKSRINTLKVFHKILINDGYICFDVNNRHNEEYGFLKSKVRYIFDSIFPDFKRGDVQFDWEIANEKIPAKGHLFNPSEVRFLLKKSGFKVVKINGVSYKTGNIYEKTFKGQIFVIAKKII